MAKTATHTQTVPRAQTIKIVTPRAPGPLVNKKTAKGMAKRGARAIGHAASEEKHRIGALIGAGVLGYLDKNSVKFPTVPMLGRAGTVGVVAYFYHKQTKNRIASHVATGALCIALYEMMTKGKIDGELDGDGPE